MSFGFSQSGFVRQTTAIEVIKAFRKKIQDSIPEFRSPASCFISDISEAPDVSNMGKQFLMICPLDGRFDQPLMDGGGNMSIAELMIVQTTIYSQVEVDRIESYEAGLIDPEIGLFALKWKLLRAIGGKNLSGGETDGNRTSVLLMEAMYPSKDGIKPHPRLEGFASTTLGFDCKFWWNTQEDSHYT